MSVPAARMQQQSDDSHGAVHAGIQALAGAAAKMGGAAAAPNPELMDALQSLHGKVDALGAGAGPGGPPDAGAQSLPDPGDLVNSDPQMAMSYAEAIMQHVAHLLLNHAAAPVGPPMPGAAPVGPDVGGENTALY